MVKTYKHNSHSKKFKSRYNKRQKSNKTTIKKTKVNSKKILKPKQNGGWLWSPSDNIQIGYDISLKYKPLYAAKNIENAPQMNIKYLLNLPKVIKIKDSPDDKYKINNNKEYTITINLKKISTNGNDNNKSKSTQSTQSTGFDNQSMIIGTIQCSLNNHLGTIKNSKIENDKLNKIIDEKKKI